MAEHLTASSNTNPRFGMCCLSGKIELPPLHPVPPELLQLLTVQDDIGKSFRDHIHNYNNTLAMTSIGRKIDESVNNGEDAVNDGVGPYVFKLHGELSHKAGSLLPPDRESPVFAQLYVYDPADAVNYCMANAWNAHLDHHTMVTHNVDEEFFYSPTQDKIQYASVFFCLVYLSDFVFAGESVHKWHSYSYY